jgi:hypothetical protein
MTQFRRAIGEAKGLADVHVLFDGSVEERSVDMKLTHLKISCGRNGEEYTKVGNAYDWGEYFRIVEASALAATFGYEPCFEAGDIAHGIRLDFVDPHLVDDHSSGGKVDEFPCAVVHEGGLHMLRSGLLAWYLGARESSPVDFLFHTVAGGKESDGGRRCARWDVVWTSNQVGHEGFFEDVFFYFTLVRMTIRRDKYRRVFGHVSHEFPVAEVVRPELRRCIVPDCTSGSFGLAEHVVGIGGRESYTDAHASTHLPGGGSLKNKVQVKLDDGGENARLKMMSCMQVA